MILIYLVFLAGLLMRAGEIVDGTSFLKEVGFPLAILTVALFAVSYKRGEKPEWRWGGNPLSK